MSGLTRPGAEEVVRRALGVRIRRVNGEFKLKDEDRALLLSGPASLIFASLDGRRSLAEVAGLVADEYGVGHEEALADTREFVADLAGRGIVEW